MNLREFCKYATLTGKLSDLSFLISPCSRVKLCLVAFGHGQRRAKGLYCFRELDLSVVT